jgi:hypothetical protein
MILFCGNKFIRQSGSLSVANISIGERIDKQCYNVELNDGSNIILPEGAKINLKDGKFLTLNGERDDCFSGTRSKFKLKKIIPEFTQKNNDPYFIALSLCLPVKNGKIQTRKKVLLDINKIPKDYFELKSEESYNDYIKISAADGFPDLLKLELKKIRNFTKLRERFIPDNYLYSCFDDRVALIRGCMDACGKFNKNETTFEVCSKQMAQDFAFLIRSIGGFCKIRVKTSKRDFYICSVSFETDFNPFLLKKTKYSVSKNPRQRSVSKIEKAGVLPCLETPLDSIVLDTLIEVS